MLGGGHADYVSQWFRRSGDPTSQDRSRGFGGIYFAAATPLPGPRWAHDIVVGLALDIPAQYVLHIDVPERPDQPVSPAYDGPPDRVASVLAVAYRIIPRLELGLGIAVAPSLSQPTSVTYVPGRSPNVNGNVEVQLDSSLDLAAAPFMGLRAQPLDWLALSLVYRDQQASEAKVPQSTTAGGILDNDRVSFFEMWDPASVVFGTNFTSLKDLSVSLDVAWHNWSAFSTGFDQELAAPYKLHDTVSIASSVEKHFKGWTLRGGVGVDPSPLPAQTGLTNYLGADTLVLALGAGFDFRRLAHLPFLIDAHIRARLDATQSAEKDPTAIAKPNDAVPGSYLIDNMGYPGFTSQALMFQAGVTATFFLGGAK